MLGNLLEIFLYFSQEFQVLLQKSSFLIDAEVKLPIFLCFLHLLFDDFDFPHFDQEMNHCFEFFVLRILTEVVSEVIQSPYVFGVLFKVERVVGLVF